jgi:hypothetical protein
MVILTAIAAGAEDLMTGTNCKVSSVHLNRGWVE